MKTSALNFELQKYIGIITAVTYKKTILKYIYRRDEIYMYFNIAFYKLKRLLSQYISVGGL